MKSYRKIFLFPGLSGRDRDEPKISSITFFLTHFRDAYGVSDHFDIFGFPMYSPGEAQSCLQNRAFTMGPVVQHTVSQPSSEIS